MDASERAVKQFVLEDQMAFLCEELGDPGRYFPYLRSKRMLDSSDCQSIRSQVTFKEQVQSLMDLLKSRQSSKGESAFDVLVDALKKQRVQAHIARALQRALAKAKEEGVVYNGLEARKNALSPEEEVANDPVVPCTTTLEDLNGDDVQYEIHPQVGALPPLPTDQPIAVSNSPVCDEQPNSMHPYYGMLPPHAENSVYAQQQAGQTAAYVANDSECELAGQSHPGSMLSSQAGSNTSSQPVSYDTASSSDVTKDLEVLKLEAKVKDLTAKLETAQAEGRKKDARIKQLLAKAGTPEPTTKNFGSHSFV